MNTRTQRVKATALCLLVVLLGACSQEPPADDAPGFDKIIAQSERLAGFVDLHWHGDSGRLYLQVSELDSPFLYITWLARGVGSNDLGLDRGKLGDTRVVRFRRTGPRVLLLQDNLDYRALSDSTEEQQAASESFAFSVIGGFDVAAEDPAGGLLVDATDFFLRDAYGVAESLAEKKEGSYEAQPELSSIFLPRTRAFPDNTEVEAVVTLVGKPEGDYLKIVAPDPTHVSVHIHHSLVRLPDDGFTAVPYEPRAGYMDPAYRDWDFADYATPISEPLRRHWLPRHRLAKKDPSADVSEPVEPIVYYLDPGAPEPMRSALLEGASWWNQAFEAAGYSNAFRVEILPEGADPMDVRYNVIQWVHRATRGWSYGASVRDPRTGEIIKGHVTLGSLRVRQDLLLAEGLLAPYGTPDRASQVQEFALARLRQLAAHEVGHTLGLEHNFAASVNDRASVMDYPHPLLRLDDAGQVDVSEAYAEGIGEWDKRAILFGYQDFPDGVDAAEARAGILEATLASGLHFVDDADSRDVGSAHPLGSLWDNGANAMDELEQLVAVRRVVLDNFSEDVLRSGRPLAQLEEALVPMYLLHRYQVQAVGKYLGGQYFSYAMRGDGQRPTTAVPAAQQRRALDLLLDTLAPDFLALDPALVSAIPPRPPGYPAGRELFSRATGPVFDPLAGAEASSRLTLQVLLHPARAARLVRMNRAEPGQPGFDQVLDAILEHSWLNTPASGTTAPLQRVVNEQVLAGLMELAADATATMQVRALVRQALGRIAGMDVPASLDDGWRAHLSAGKHLAKKQMEAAQPQEWTPPAPPPGSPIGLQ